MTYQTRRTVIIAMVSFLVFLSIIKSNAPIEDVYIPDTEFKFHLMQLLLFIPPLLLLFAIKFKNELFFYFPLGWIGGAILGFRPVTFIQAGTIPSLSPDNITYVMIIAGFCGLFACFAYHFLRGSKK